MVEFEPIFSRGGDHPMAKKDHLIKQLKYWVAVLAVADVIYTAFAVLVIWSEIVK